MTWTHAGKVIDKDSPPLLVGVINLSSESFYKGSIAQEPTAIQSKIDEMKQYDVDCLDVGAMSTRPLDIYGGERAGIETEKSRVRKYLPIIMDIVSSYDIPVALDTQYLETAKIGLNLGVRVINDISGFKTDPQLPSVLADYGVDVVIMATKNQPGDVCGIEETISELNRSIQIGTQAGIDRSQISIDPGFGGWQGRGKDCDMQLLSNFSRLHQFDLPIYVGVSRKSTISTLGGGIHPADRLEGSIVVTNWLVDRGAKIIRTHDVKATRLALNVHHALKNY